MTAMHDSQDDLWVEFRKRREEWRTRRDARRAAWRARFAARRAARCSEGWGHWGSAADWGLDPSGWGMDGGRSEEIDALKAKVAEMEKTIAQLNERIIVLEKLATSDDGRLAAEIEKLCGQ
jgi:hypothetical protein